MPICCMQFLCLTLGSSGSFSGRILHPYKPFEISEVAQPQRLEWQPSRPARGRDPCLNADTNCHCGTQLSRFSRQIGPAPGSGMAPAKPIFALTLPEPTALNAFSGGCQNPFLAVQSAHDSERSPRHSGLSPLQKAAGDDGGSGKPEMWGMPSRLSDTRRYSDPFDRRSNHRAVITALKRLRERSGTPRLSKSGTLV